MEYRLFRVIHESRIESPLVGYHAPGRCHVSVEQAAKTSYLSTSIDTCRKESGHHLAGTVRLRERLVVEFVVELTSVVNLTDPVEREKLGIDLNELISEDLSVPQHTASQLRKKGIQAIVLPSARDPRGHNVVLFMENVDGSLIRKIREERLE